MKKHQIMDVVNLVVMKLTEMSERSYDEFDIEEWNHYTELVTDLDWVDEDE